MRSEDRRPRRVGRGECALSALQRWCTCSRIDRRDCPAAHGRATGPGSALYLRTKSATDANAASDGQDGRQAAPRRQTESDCKAGSSEVCRFETRCGIGSGCCTAPDSPPPTADPIVTKPQSQTDFSSLFSEGAAEGVGTSDVSSSASPRNFRVMPADLESASKSDLRRIQSRPPGPAALRDDRVASRP